MILPLLLASLLWTQPPKVVNRPFPAKQRRDTSVTYIVIHYDSSPDPKTTFNFLKRKRNSYNYYIARNGTIYKMIDPAYKANHAGLSFYDGHVRMNNYSIGICFENKYPQAYTDAQYKSGAWLVSKLYERFPDARTHPLLGHSDIAIPRGRKHDPGDHFSWSTFHSLIK
jgi:AmpD protein